MKTHIFLVTWKIFMVLVLTREQPNTDYTQPIHSTSKRPHKEDITSDMRQYNHKRINFKAFDKQEYNSIFCSANDPLSGHLALPCVTALVDFLLQQFKG